MRKILIVIFIGLLLFEIGNPVIAHDQDFKVVIDFTDGFYNWGSFGSGFVEISDEQALSGTKSLKVTGRTAGWNGASLDIDPILTSGGTYVFSIYVRLADASTDALGHLTVRSTTKSGETEYTWISNQIPLSNEEWVLIESNPYTYDAGSNTSASIYIEVSDATASYYIDQFSIIGDRSFTGSYALLHPQPAAVIDNTLPIPGLKDVYREHFYVGFSTGMNYHHATDLIHQHFNAFTPENQLKWESVHPQETQYSFWAADTLADFAHTNDLKLIGHTLVWHSQTPDWVFEHNDGTLLERDQLLSRMQEHINTVAGHYQGQVYSWDVINEAVEFVDGSWGLRDSKWHEIIGDDYLEYAFRFAHTADPNAQLYYNDYSTTNPGKRDAIFNLVQDLLAKDVPIDGIGMQGHWSIFGPSEQELRDALNLYASLGVKLSITELDVSVYDYADRENRYPVELPDSIHDQQANQYANFFRIFKQYSDVIDRVTFWGTNDRYSWKNNHPQPNRPDHPLLFDRQNEIKPAFWAILDLDRPWYVTKGFYDGALKLTNIHGDALVTLIPGKYTIDELQTLGLDFYEVDRLQLSRGYIMALYPVGDFQGKPLFFRGSCPFPVAEFLDAFGFVISAMEPQNLLPGNPVDASHLQERAERAIDGDLFTSWGPRNNPPYWISADLGKLHLLTGWRVYHRGSGGITSSSPVEGPLNTADFCLQLSMDGQSWHTVDTIEDNTAGVTDRPLDLVEARYVRLLVTKPSSFDFNQDLVIYEWEVFGLNTEEAVN